MAQEPDEVDAVAAELYRLPPAEFTAARTARSAAATGPAAKAIAALRKPVVAAWAVNLLAADGQLAEAAELGAALRAAQDDLDAAELTALGRQRRQLVEALANRAAELAEKAGTALSPAVREAVARTINAAVMNEDAAAAALTGRLQQPLDTGVDPRDAVAGSAPRPVAGAPADDLAERRARKAAERAVRESERAASDAERALARLDARLSQARERADLLHERIDELRAQLARAEADAEKADAESATLETERRAAASASDAAKRAAERARADAPD